MFVNPPASEIGAKVMSGASSSQVTSSEQQSGLSQTINPKYEAWHLSLINYYLGGFTTP